MRFIPFALVLSVVPLSAALGGELDPKPIRAAIDRSIPWLEQDMVVWRKKHDCAACHHGPMYLWSIHVAKRQGYAVADSQLQEYAKWMIDDPTARIFPAAETSPIANPSSEADRMTATMMGRRNLSQPTLYFGHALNALPTDDPLVPRGWEKLQNHWRASQMDDGSFAGRSGRPPIFNVPQILTLYATTALDDRHSTRQTDPLQQPLGQIRKHASDFLASQPPDTTHHGLVLRLLAHLQAKSPQSPTLLAELKALQREDGGWSQSPDRPSDAFATGQSLYALHRAGISATDDSVHRGLRYLVDTQSNDGAWPMTSRIDPETGRPAKNLNPITYAATAWAVLGLSSHVPNNP